MHLTQQKITLDNFIHFYSVWYLKKRLQSDTFYGVLLVTW